MKSSCGNCAYPIATKHSLRATWVKPIKCPKCEVYNYRPHSISSLLFIVGCGLTIVSIYLLIFVTKNVVIDKILLVIGSSVVLFTVECMFLPLKSMDLEKKKKINRREMLWIAIFFSMLLILAMSVR